MLGEQHSKWLRFPGTFLVAAVVALFHLFGRVPVDAAEPGEAAEKDVSGTLAKPTVPRSISSNAAYLKDLETVRHEFAQFSNDARWRSSLSARWATLEADVGNYRKALEVIQPLDAPSDSRPANPAPQAFDGTRFNELEACDAAETMVELADQRQVVMINEAHHVPMHRAFTIQLLERLYQKGYRYFAAETLNIEDEELQTRGYPVLKTGYYTEEPIYADLVRTALRLGYKVVPYEFVPPPIPGQENDPTVLFRDRKQLVARQNAREEGQAKNLQQRILAKDPNAKILVHAGYGHIAKIVHKMDGSTPDEQLEMAMMGHFFKKLTGIDPLCVTQVQRFEQASAEMESPEYRYVVESNLVKRSPVIFRNRATKQLYPPVADQTGLDLVVYHPRSQYQDGRPTWLAMGGLRSPFKVMDTILPPQGKSYLVQAFLSNETGPDVVPVDQLEYSTDQAAPVLWLSHGTYRIRIIDAEGNSLQESSIMH